MMDIMVDCHETLLISDIEKIIIENINPIINTIQNYIEQSGYKLLLFESFENTNIEILDLKYIIKYNINKHFALEVTQIERLRGDLATQWRNQYGCDHPREG